MRQIILDTETTGLDPKTGHKIIEIGCLEMMDRRLTGNYFHHYINPNRDIDPGAIAIHGITNEAVRDKPLFSAVASDLINFIKGAELIIHNAPFDVGFLNHELLATQQFKAIKDYCEIIDTLVLARKLHPGQKNNLDALCKRYSVNNSHREFHGALLDAELLAFVYLAMTGGQTTLFGDETNAENNNKSVTPSEQSVSKNIVLPVIKSSDEEKALHHDYLSKINKATDGKCLWPNVNQQERA